MIAGWTDGEIRVEINDDGPGFAPEIMDRIGEPYVRSRRRRRMYGGETTGLGLGFFIAKTLLERSGATLAVENRTFPQHGAVVTVRWGRADFERPLARRSRAFELGAHLRSEIRCSRIDPGVLALPRYG